MGEIIYPTFPNHFPVGRPFEITDQHNGKRRGTWFFRSPLHGDVRGPYATRLIAMMAYSHDKSLLD